jgi:hypothetical protein
MIEDNRSMQDDQTGQVDEFAPDPRNVRLLKWAIYIMSALLVIGVIVVGVTIANRASKLAGDGTRGFGVINVPAGQGSVISRMAVGDDRVAIHLRDASGAEEIVIVNIRRGTVEGRIRVGGAAGE